MSQSPPRSGGSYVLVFYAPKAATTVVGALGQIDIQRGYYLYVGSAHGGGGLQARINRHLQIDKALHWHMDYLRPQLRPHAVWWQACEEKLEDLWVELMPQLGAEPSVRGFGASDSRHNTHLFFSPTSPQFKHWCSLAPGCSCWAEPS